MLLCRCEREVDQEFVEKSEMPDQSEVIISGKPLLFVPADPNCQNEAKISDYSTIKIWSYDQHKKKASIIIKNLNDVFSATDNDKVISSITYNAKIIQNNSSLKTLQLTDEGKPLFFCTSGPYPRQSVENTALVMLLGINKIVNLLKEQDLLNRFPIPSVKLLIYPLFYITEQVATHILHKPQFNNAFWINQSQNNDFLISLLPHDQNYALNNEVMISDQPAVFSHEYGHHIYANIAPQIRALENQRKLSSFVAFNEAIADFIARFAFEDNDFSIASLIHDNRYFDRDITSDHFDNGWPKVITEPVINNFANSQIKQKFSAHKLGAMIAYIFYRFAKNNHLGLSHYLIWLNDLDKSEILEVLASQNNLTVLEELLKSFVVSHPLNTSNCNLAKVLIPWLDRQWSRMCSFEI